MARRPREKRYMIEWLELHPHYRLEVYSTKPWLRIRDLITGRFIRMPDEIYLKVIKGGETSGGSEPIEVEIVAVEAIEIEELLAQAEYYGPEEVVPWIHDRVKEINREMIEEIRAEFGHPIAEIMEERGWELMLEGPEERVKRWRWLRGGRWTPWREATW